MRLSRTYTRTRFSGDVLKEAAETLLESVNAERRYVLNVGLPEGTWTHDNLDEFFADYRRSNGGGGVFKVEAAGHSLRVQNIEGSALIDVEVDVGASVNSRARILSTYEVLDRNMAACALPPVVSKRKPVVFIGHGRSDQWKNLKDHLRDQHGYEIEAFENGARAGHTIRDVLHSMMTNSSFALLVMTGEDSTDDGLLRARQNVIHEAGLFQGKLGFERAIVLLEKGVDEFSNIQGITQIRFSPGNIRETFGDVLATLRREFPSPA